MKQTFKTSTFNNSQRVENCTIPTQYESPIRTKSPALSGTAALICHLVLIIALAGVTLFGGPASVAQAKSQAQFSIEQTNEYIVVFKENQVGAENNGLTIEDYATTLASIYNGQVTHIYNLALSGFAAELSAEGAAEIATLDDVEMVVENIAMSIDITPMFQRAGNQTSATWGLDRTDQRDLPLNSAYGYRNEAESVHVYVLDTGIRASHDEFGGRVGPGYSTISDGIGTDDCQGHGTHVAGTIGGTQYGIAKKAMLYPVRVLDCNGGGTLAGVLAGVEWVTANHAKPAVANMSLGGSANAVLEQAIQKSVATGVTYVVAAGNKDIDACLRTPANVDEAITVGATNNSDDRTHFSNHGSCVDIFAPGEDITSAWNNSDSGTRTIDGTSMASPHVAGAAALYLHENPNDTPAQVFQALLNEASQNKLSNIGTGSPNLLLYAAPGTVPTPSVTPPTVTTTPTPPTVTPTPPTPTITPSVTPTPLVKTMLYIDSSPLTMAVGETKTLSIKVNTGNADVNGAQINGKVDPSYLKIVDVQSNSDKLSQVLDSIQFDANAGTFRYGAGTLSGIVNGDFEVLRVRVEALAETNSTAIEFLTSFPTSDISGPTGSVLEETQNGAVEISGGAPFIGEVQLQSRPNGTDPSKVIALMVEFYQPGGNSPVKSFNVSTDEDARFTVSGIAPGTYDVRMWGNNTLTSRVKDVVVESGTTRAFLGPLMAGDIIQNNEIVVEDFGPFSAGFNQQEGRSGFDSRTDLNNDGHTNIKDFALISGNFNKQGDLEYPFDNPPVLVPSIAKAQINLGATSLEAVVGELFEVPVWVDPNGNDVNGVTVNLRFDPSLVEIISVNLSSAALATTLQAPVIDTNSGRVEFSVGALGTAQRNSFQVATLTVRAKAPTSNTAVNFERNEFDGTEITDEQGSVFDGLSGVNITANCPESTQDTTGDFGIGDIDFGTDVTPNSCPPPTPATKVFLPIIVR